MNRRHTEYGGVSKGRIVAVCGRILREVGVNETGEVE